MKKTKIKPYSEALNDLKQAFNDVLSSHASYLLNSVAYEAWEQGIDNSTSPLPETHKFSQQDFASRMLHLRQALHLSQEQAATLLGISRVCLVRYENGTRTPSADALARICTGYRISADWLLFGKTN